MPSSTTTTSTTIATTMPQTLDGPWQIGASAGSPASQVTAPGGGGVSAPGGEIVTPPGAND